MDTANSFGFLGSIPKSVFVELFHTAETHK